MTKVRMVDKFSTPVRLAFAQHLFVPGTVNGEGDPAYSVTAIIPKDHPVVAELLAAEEEVAKAKWGEKATATLKAIRSAGKGVLKDGDLKANYAGFEGNYYVSMRAKQDQKPNVFDNKGRSVTERDGVIYSGCYAHVMVSVWAQDNGYGKRINAQVTGVAFSRDGDSFGGGAAPAAPDDFADLSVPEDEDMLG